MSLAFSNTTLKNGIIQQIEKNCGFDDGQISGNATLLAQFTGDVNLALDDALAIILPASGTWQFDDSNQADYPIITTALVGSPTPQRDYSFVTDNSGNLILDIYKVMCRVSATGPYQDLIPVDQQSDEDVVSFYNGLNVSGVPSRYDKTANGIFLDLIPNYNSTDGLKIFINREGSYFSVTDTTKKPGFAGLFHEYCVLKPSYNYARSKGLQNVERLERDLLKMEKAMDAYYSDRERDADKSIEMAEINFM